MADDHEDEPAARKASSGPGWPLESPPGATHHDSAGRQWATAPDGRAWIEADGLWYPSFPETMGG